MQLPPLRHANAVRPELYRVRPWIRKHCCTRGLVGPYQLNIINIDIDISKEPAFGNITI